MATHWSTGFTEPVKAIKRSLRFPNGHNMPLLGFGTRRAEPDKVGPAISHAIDRGFRFFDCSPVYSNQVQVGASLKNAMAFRRVSRGDLFVSSKLWCTDMLPHHVETACRRTLKELQLEYLDLFLVHWPVCWRHKSDTWRSKDDSHPTNADGFPDEIDFRLADTWKAMEGLVTQKLVRSIGLCNCSLAQINELSTTWNVAPSVCMVEMHPGHQEHKLRNELGLLGILMCAFSPLGIPTGSADSEHCPSGGVVGSKLVRPISEFSGFTPARLLLNWGVDSSCGVIVKSTDNAHIDDNSKVEYCGMTGPMRYMLNRYEQSDSFRVNNPILTRDGKRFFDR